MPSSASFVSGQVIANKYLFEGILGRGAMGVVLAARHMELRHLVAIKVLAGDVAAVKTARERFLREARVAARVHSQHVCRVLDTGTLEDGTPFFVMEYLDGVDLCAELQQRGRMELIEAIGYIRQACEALSVAHGAGVIHRDLKPANMFLLGHSGRSRRLKVLDFGVSKALLEHGALTSTATLVGSPLYMSPEQLDCARDVDARSDLWSLGAVLYELLTGAVPFIGNTLAQVITAILQREPASFASHGITLPPGVEDVIRLTLSKSRAQRPASAAEFSKALAPFAGSRADSEGAFGRWSESFERERETLDEMAAPEPTPQRRIPALRRAIVTSEPGTETPAPPSSRQRAWQLGALAGVVTLAAALIPLWPSGTNDTPSSIETQTQAAVARAGDAGSANMSESPARDPQNDGANEPAQPALRLAAAGARAPTSEPLPEGQAPADPAEPLRVKVAAPRRAPAPEPQKLPVPNVHQVVVPIDPLEIPGFGGRH